MKYLLVLAALCVVVFAQTEEKIIIDGYEVDGFVFFQTPSGYSLNDPAVPCASGQQFGCTQQTAQVLDSSVLGGERDFFLSAEDGSLAPFQTSVGDITGNIRAWSSSTPNDSSGFSLLQYDGQDGTSNLDINGLDEDLSVNLSQSFRVEVMSDVNSLLSVDVYEGGQTCSVGPFTIPGNAGVSQDIEFDFTDFSGNCAFSNVGAIEILVEMFANVDVSVTKFVTFGPVSPSASNTPTRTPTPASNPSATRTVTPSPAPTPPPSVSRTPTRTPSPVVDVCDCNCPTFFCGLVYAVPHDDDDGVDDEWFDDDESIIYRPVYYEPVDDDFYGRDGTDDHDNVTFEGGLTRDHNDDDDDVESSSTAASIGVSAVAVLAASAALMLLA